MIEMAEKLTPGCIEPMKRGKYIENPIIQLLNYIPPIYPLITSLGPYHLIISDGSQSITVLLAPELNELITDGKLKKNSIICLNQYRFLDIRINKKKLKVMTVVSKITVVTDGNIIGKVINGLGKSTYPLIELPTRDKDLRVPSVMTAKLTHKCLEAITHGQKIKNPVIQILSIKRAMTDYLLQPHYRVRISDGTDFCSMVLLNVNLSKLVTKGELKKYAVVRLNNYISFGCCGIDLPEMLMIHDLTVIARGKDVGGIIRLSPELSKKGLTFNYFSIGIVFVIITSLFLLFKLSYQ